MTTVAQLGQTLVAARAAHKTDGEIARQVGVLEPSERISDATLSRLTQFASGPQTGLALQLLADKSAFLDLPAGELPALPPPDPAARQKQLEAVRKFALETLSRLPNLLATRTTFNFDNSAQETLNGASLEREGLHLVGTVKAEVSVRSEKENLTVGGGKAPSGSSNGLVTWGEFGSALLLILSDSAPQKTIWSHWEQGATGPVSVFDYTVPKSASHYEIATPLEPISSPWSWYRGAAGVVPPDIYSTKVFHTKPAYHGSLWIDVASGAILRLSLIADLKGNPTLEYAAILIEYGPVRVKDKTFICPIRSIAFSAAPASVRATLQGAATEWLNENLFTDYHLFASTSRILSEKSE